MALSFEKLHMNLELDLVIVNSTRFKTIINYSAPIRRLRQVEPHMLGKFTSNHVQVYHQYSRPVPVKKPVKVSETTRGTRILVCFRFLVLFP